MLRYWSLGQSYGSVSTSNGRERGLTTLRYRHLRLRSITYSLHVPLIEILEVSCLFETVLFLYISGILLIIVRFVEWEAVKFDYPKFEPNTTPLEEIKPPPYRPFRWGKYKYVPQ